MQTANPTGMGVILRLVLLCAMASNTCDHVVFQNSMRNEWHTEQNLFSSVITTNMPPLVMDCMVLNIKLNWQLRHPPPQPCIFSFHPHPSHFKTCASNKFCLGQHATVYSSFTWQYLALCSNLCSSPYPPPKKTKTRLRQTALPHNLSNKIHRWNSICFLWGVVVVVLVCLI